MLKIIKDILPLFSYRFDLSSINRRFSLVFFTTISAFLFLNFFEPFGLYYGKVPAQEVFVELFVATTFTFVILIISQFVFRPLFKVYKSTLSGLAGWFILEAVMVAITWSFLDRYVGEIPLSMYTLWIGNFKAYIAIMLLPYTLYVVYIYFKDRLSTVAIIQEHKEIKKSTLAIKDESDEVQLLLDNENLLFIKSADNYIELNYLENDSLQKKLIRNSIKRLEADLQDSSIIRCHRSYMLNTNQIESAQKTSAGFEVRLRHLPELSIPVSRTYVSELKKHALAFK